MKIKNYGCVEKAKIIYIYIYGNSQYIKNVKL